MQASSGHPSQLRVSVVLHHSNLDQLRACLLSLRESIAVAQSRLLLGEVKVCLVDNTCEAAYAAQLDGVLGEISATGKTAHTAFLSMEVVSPPTNLGFGHGHNLAMGGFSSDYHLVLNPDAQLLPDTLSEGLALLEEKRDIILASPAVEGSEGEQEFLCKRYPSVLVLLLRGFAPKVLRDLFRGVLSRYEMREECSQSTSAQVSIASGCFMLLRTQALRVCGGFDERYFLYFEDFDLSLRLQKQGQLVFAPKMKIIHHGGYAARKGLRHVGYFIASGVRFFRQHGWRWI